MKYLIINADDFGLSEGVNRGILESHTRGVVTSASLMVTGDAVHEAVALARDHPKLGVGFTGTCGARTNGNSISVRCRQCAMSIIDNWSSSMA